MPSLNLFEFSTIDYVYWDGVRGHIAEYRRLIYWPKEQLPLAYQLWGPREHSRGIVNTLYAPFTRCLIFYAQYGQHFIFLLCFGFVVIVSAGRINWSFHRRVQRPWHFRHHFRVSGSLSSLSLSIWFRRIAERPLQVEVQPRVLRWRQIPVRDRH